MTTPNGSHKELEKNILSVYRKPAGNTEEEYRHYFTKVLGLGGIKIFPHNDFMGEPCLTVMGIQKFNMHDQPIATCAHVTPDGENALFGSYMQPMGTMIEILECYDTLDLAMCETPRDNVYKADIVPYKDRRGYMLDNEGFVWIVTKDRRLVNLTANARTEEPKAAICSVVPGYIIVSICRHEVSDVSDNIFIWTTEKA